MKIQGGKEAVMKQFYIITNENKDPSFGMTNQIRDYLEKMGAVCLVKREQEKPLPETECILVLGGDGTLLQAARDTIGRDIPLVGVNLGTVGFMAEVEKEHIEEALCALLADRFTLERRMMLDGIVISEGEQKEPFAAHALNDVVVTRQGSLKILSYEVYVNGQFLAEYHADGLIVATPTGSTGYNMSAGGPIVEPEARLIVLTPICPHTLSPRSIILSAEDKIEIRIGADRNGNRQEAMVNFDGSVERGVSSGERILITQSKRTTCFAAIGQSGFLEKLHRKMG